jgi:flavin-binding protein dodecin
VAEPFERRSAPGGGLLRALRGRARSGAIREIEDLLARAERVSEVDPEQVAEIARRHGVDLERRLRTARLDLYRRFFEQCLRDQSVSEEERQDLAHLRRLLRLEPADVHRVHEDVACVVYGDAIDRVLEDQRLDPEEEDFLRKLRDELALPDSVAERLMQEGSARARRRFLDRAVQRDDFLLTSKDVTLELSGDSEQSLEAAVAGAVEEACLAVDDLGWVEVTRIGVEVAEGRVARWHVKLRAKRDSGA